MATPEAESKVLATFIIGLCVITYNPSFATPLALHIVQFRQSENVIIQDHAVIKSFIAETPGIPARHLYIFVSFVPFSRLLGLVII